MSLIVEESCIIGTQPGAGIRLMPGSASRNHAMLKVREDKGAKCLWIVDLNHTLGIYLNGQRINKLVKLNEGDSIQVGVAILKIECILPVEQSRPMDTRYGLWSRLFRNLNKKN